MARKQTRRTVSVSGVIGDRIAAYSATHGISMSQIVEQAIAPVLRDEKGKGP